MPNPHAVAEDYISAWNESDSGRRRALMALTWTQDASYADPLMRGEGLDEIDALIAGVQQRFPGWRFAVAGRPDAHGDHVRFSWALGPDGADSVIEGADFALVQDGRLKSVIGFLDKIPAEA